MAELKLNSIIENELKKPSLGEIQQVVLSFIKDINPILYDNYKEWIIVRKNKALEMTKAIHNRTLTREVYEQILLATCITEGLTSWTSEELNRVFDSRQPISSPEFHRNFIDAQTNRFSIFEGDSQNVLDVPINALSRFPHNPSHYLDFFSQHAIFCVTQSLSGHISVNNILQPLSKELTTDDAITHLVTHQPLTLKDLFNSQKYIQEQEL